MQRHLIEQDLLKARRYVVAGAQDVLEQREQVIQLEAAGQDTKEARTLLAQFEEIQAMNIAEVEKLLAELATSARGIRQ